MADTLYDAAFYDENEGGSYRSACVLLDLAMPILEPESVLDVGCGIGTWLRAASERGARCLHGIDGAYIDRSRFHIDPVNFSPADLADAASVRKAVEGKRFDLAMCLEAAEHVPTAAARGLVSALGEASDVVLWSAATPGQGGTCHINERPLTYWASLWNELGFVPVDMLRPGLQFTGIDLWYMQNAILFVRRPRAPAVENAFRAFYEHAFGFVPPLAFVHYAALSTADGLPPAVISDRLAESAGTFQAALAAELELPIERIERVDFAWEGLLLWVGFRPADAPSVQPLLLLFSPYRMTLDIGLYYPSWQVQQPEIAATKDRVGKRGLVWNDPLGYKLEGWTKIRKADLAMRLSLSLMEGTPEETAIVEAARDAARLWSAYHGA